MCVCTERDVQFRVISHFHFAPHLILLSFPAVARSLSPSVGPKCCTMFFSFSSHHHQPFCKLNHSQVLAERLFTWIRSPLPSLSPDRPSTCLIPPPLHPSCSRRLLSDRILDLRTGSCKESSVCVCKSRSLFLLLPVRYPRTASPIFGFSLTGCH